jgi:hypothetical protein
MKLNVALALGLGAITSPTPEGRAGGDRQEPHGMSAGAVQTSGGIRCGAGYQRRRAQGLHPRLREKPVRRCHEFLLRNGRMPDASLRITRGRHLRAGSRSKCAAVTFRAREGTARNAAWPARFGMRTGGRRALFCNVVLELVHVQSGELEHDDEKKPAPDLIGGGTRLSEKIMPQQQAKAG